MSGFSVREQIIQAAVALVNASPPTGVPACQRTRAAPSENVDPGVLVCFPLDEETEPQPKTGRFGPTVTHTFTLQFVGYATDTIPDQALDPILVWLSQCLGGQQFGGLAIQTTPRKKEWNYSQSNVKAAAVAVGFSIEFKTLRNDESQVG